MNKYLVKHYALIGRSDNSDMAPMELTFYTVETAQSEEQVQDKAVQYKDPFFTTKVMSITEMGDEISSDELAELLKPSEVMQLMGQAKPQQSAAR